MDDIECPRCKTTRYSSRDMKLMVNICGHALCETCVDMLFAKGSGNCPECGIPLRRTNFRFQIFEDSSVEKELDIRRKILKDYNKAENDFNTLLEYNDYLEEIETIIFNLANNVDVEGTKRKVEQYKKENKTQIMKNKGKRSKEEEALDDMLEVEKYETETRKQEIEEAELEVVKSKQKKKEALIDDLMFSDLPAQDIIASHASSTENQEPVPKPIRRKGRTTFSLGTKDQKHVYMPIPKQSSQNLYKYSSPIFETSGPKCFSPNSLNTMGFMEHVRAAAESEIASGFVSEYACQRALEDAFNGVLIFSEI